MTNKFIEQRVEALENELSELKLIVAQIRKPSTVVEEALANDIIEFEGKQYKKVDREALEGDVVITSHESSFVKANKYYKVARCNEFVYIEDAEIPVYNVGRTLETVDVYELINYAQVSTPESIAEWESKTKTANQLRAEIIEKAKGFVEEGKDSRGRYEVEKVGSIFGIPKLCLAQFIVNLDKRTVVVLLRGFESGRLYKRGIAKCMPSDVFNEHIGKAIALGRALGLDVSEFEQAVQPSLAVGQECVIKNWEGHNGKTLTITKVFDNGKKANHNYKYGYLEDCHLTIINDTNAIYETAVGE